MIIEKIKIKNFKKLGEITFSLSSPLVLIGPNNSGKTSVLQAITLLETGLKKINTDKKTGSVRTGVSINRKDLLSIPIPGARLLWNNKNVRAVEKAHGVQKTKNINIEISAEGFMKGTKWQAALEFDYANEESFYCRALRKDDAGNERFIIDKSAFELKVAYLQPMSGLATTEDRLTPGSIDRKIGEGKTADVIRNICYQLLHPDREIDAIPEHRIKERWQEINHILNNRFGITINEPTYNPDNGLIEMTYNENNIQYDLSSAGRGFQQVLLVICFLYANSGKVILMDEPDAHLEFLRQKEIYNLIADITRKNNCQLIIASHSEVVLDEAAGSDKIIAIIEQKAIELNHPHMLKEARKSLTDIGWHKYYLAKLKGHCIFLEGSTDERNIKAFAQLINHPVSSLLSDAFIDMIEGNIPGEAHNRFRALKLIEPELKGLAIFDKLDKNIDPNTPLKILQWSYRELENYFCTPEVFIRWAKKQAGDLFALNYPEIMGSVINDVFPKLYLENPNDDFWKSEKMGDWAERVFQEFYKRIGQPVFLRKGNFYELITLLKPDEVHPEITEKLDMLYQVLKKN